VSHIGPDDGRSRPIGGPALPHQNLARGAAHRDVIPAHPPERGSHAHVGDPPRPVAHPLRVHDLTVPLHQARPPRHSGALPGAAWGPRAFGSTRVGLGIGMLVIGILYHVQFMNGRREIRKEMKAEGLIYGQSKFPVSMTLVVAILLLVLGIFAIVSMNF